MNQAYQVKLDAFEGPLDLLLHLIKQYEIDIYDIPVAEITEQYMTYIHTMQVLELNVASEYLVMAATLIAIKSQMLLPNQATNTEDEFEEDPRDELMERLIEYRKYREAAGELKEKEQDENQTFTRQPTLFSSEGKESELSSGAVSIYDMLGALNKMFERKKWDQPLESRITHMDIPIEDKMDEILFIVKKSKQGIAFDDLFQVRTRSSVVLTFMALLELMKNNDVYCKQKNHFSTLHVYSSNKES